MTVALGLYGPHACGPRAFALLHHFLVTMAFGPCVGAAYMPPAKRYRRWAFTVCVMFILYCRAGDLARRTDDFLKFYNVRRGQDPALQNGVYGRFFRKPRATVHLCRAAYMPPLQIRGSRTRTRKRYPKANVHGPHACGPYKPTGKRMLIW